MASKVTVLRVFVASPSDVNDEREILAEVVEELNAIWCSSNDLRLDLVRWETHSYPGMGKYPQAVINEQIGENYDIFVGIMWARFGSNTGGGSESGTQEEFQIAFERYQRDPDQTRIMFYFKDAPIQPSQIDPGQLAKVTEFKASLGELGTLWRSFADTANFKQLVSTHLTRQLQDWQKGWGTGVNKSSTYETNSLAIVDHTISLAERGLVREDDDDGFLDLLERAEDSLISMKAIVERMSIATTDLGEKFEQRTSELNKMKDSQNGYNIRQAKRIGNRAAEDMEHFVQLMDTEIPTFGEQYRLSVSSIAKAAALLSDFGDVDKVAVRSAFDAIRVIRGSLVNARISTYGFRSVVEGLPRLTADIKRAKRHVSSTLGRLLDEFASADALASEAEKLLEEMMGIIGHEPDAIGA